MKWLARAVLLLVSACGPQETEDQAAQTWCQYWTEASDYDICVSSRDHRLAISGDDHRAYADEVASRFNGSLVLATTAADGPATAVASVSDLPQRAAAEEHVGQRFRLLVQVTCARECASNDAGRDIDRYDELVASDPGTPSGDGILLWLDHLSDYQKSFLRTECGSQWLFFCIADVVVEIAYGPASFWPEPQLVTAQFQSLNRNELFERLQARVP